ncbi:receptor kinase-like protein Xa21 [Helianthus annuus]|uniref:non-specific serine/threonine protein kinase n=2 Tax=Helianthus annuus TaxID=4232 RepID=A0A251UDA1_HELAN|nr:receptor kinase-like protein Xa21 [Helianthus annuus]
MQPIPSSYPMRFLFYVILVIFLTSTSISSSYDGGNETDHHALLKIKSMITRDPYGALTSWNTSLHFCDWYGVKCGKRHRRVTFVALQSLGLEGSLSPHVGNLSFLRVFSLANNSFQGAIPHEIGNLNRLTILYLGANTFNGVIPTNLSGCLNLQKLDLSRNKLVGSIPKEISFLSKLSFLSLGLNKLTGGIPPFLGNITSMETFSVVRNPVGGIIPDTLGNWKKLVGFHSGGCNLSGSIPHSIYNLSLLANFILFENQLTGSLPRGIGAMFSHLEILELNYNQLTGPLPSWISNCSKLRGLDMTDNMFSGKLTIDFSKLGDIEGIYLSFNNFGSSEADEMNFIDSLKNCTTLYRLALAFCKFQGVLPRSIGNLSDQLGSLTLYGNNLHGNLPTSIGNLVGLAGLHLGRNQFTGSIPSTIGKLQKLQYFDLYGNQLSGQLPDALGNLSSLLQLYLFSNKLEGVIPSSIGNCRHLIALQLDDNKFTGKIPQRILQLSSLSIILNLSQNNLFGSLPTEVGDLKMLSALDLSYNNLSGNIPSSLGSCGSLTSLSLKGNLFQGMIPPSLSSLKGLVELDISHNNLSGQIPRFLERFLLEYLNLSYNDFEGEVPQLGVFANASAFSILGNSRLCGGVVELGLPKCKETKKHKEKFPVFVIIILIASSLFTIICLAYAWCKKKSKSRPSQSSMRDRFLKISYAQLLKATNGFSETNLIGNGGFSSVYKGVLNENDDTLVAVKVLRLQNRGAERSFMRECEAWRNIRHRNLLRIITSCSSIDFQGNDFKALVYEFMPKGSLHDWLYTSEGTSRLNYIQITNILADVASALDYLHNHCVPIVVHGDLKPSNILLNDEMVAHVGDFGLARFLGTTSYQNSSTGIRGTIGYAAPEYGLGSDMTTNGDVYSFGMLLLEVMTGKKPTDDIFNEGHSLHKFASMALPDHVMDIIDLNILNIYQGVCEADAQKIEECLASTIKIGVSCSLDSPSLRMNMEKVVHELHRIQNTLPNIEI